MWEGGPLNIRSQYAMNFQFLSQNIIAFCAVAPIEWRNFLFVHLSVRLVGRLSPLG